MVNALVVALLAGPPCAGTMVIRSPQAKVAVGEPLKVVVQIEATADTWDVDVDDPLSGLALLVRNRDSERPYVESRPMLGTMVWAPREPLRKGQRRSFAVAFWRGQDCRGQDAVAEGAPCGQTVFLRPGRHAIRLVQADSKGSTRCASNALTIDVTEPTPEGEAVIALLRDGGPGTEITLQDLLARDRKNPYLRTARLDEAAGRVSSGGCASQQKDAAELLLGELTSDHWGVFEEEALGLAYQCARQGVDKERSAAILQRLRKDWGDGPILARILERDAQDPNDER